MRINLKIPVCHERRGLSPLSPFVFISKLSTPHERRGLPPCPPCPPKNLKSLQSIGNHLHLFKKPLYANYVALPIDLYNNIGGQGGQGGQATLYKVCRCPPKNIKGGQGGQNKE